MSKKENISIEECFNNLMEIEMMSMQLEDVYTHYRKIMQNFREDVRKWKNPPLTNYIYTPVVSPVS
jgi:hypothetical protein